MRRCIGIVAICVMFASCASFANSYVKGYTSEIARIPEGFRLEEGKSPEVMEVKDFANFAANTSFSDIIVCAMTTNMPVSNYEKSRREALEYLTQYAKGNGYPFIAWGVTDRRFVSALFYYRSDADFVAGICAKDNGRQQLVVTKVTEGSAAFYANVLIGDVIVRFNGISVSSDEEWSKLKASVWPGDAISIELERRGRIMSIGFVNDSSKEKQL